METKIYKGCERLYQVDKINNLKELLQQTEKKCNMSSML